MASYLPPSEPPGCPNWDAPSTEDLEDAHAAGIRTRRGFHPSPRPTPTRAPAPVAVEPDLDVIPESCPAGGEVEAETPPRAPTPPPALTPPASEKTGQVFTGWECGSKEEVAQRRLKLADAVYAHKAYDCPHGTKTKRWKSVVEELKSNNSILFAQMRGPESASHVGVLNYWNTMYAEWCARDDLGAKTSGAREDHDEFDQQMENIRKAHKGGEGKAGNKRSRNSYGIGGTREEALAKLNQVIAGSIRGQAAVAAENVRRQIEDCEVDDNGVVNPGTVPEKEPPAKRKSRGQGRASSLHQSASLFSEAAEKRAEVDRQRITLERAALASRNEEAAAMRANTERLFEMFAEQQRRADEREARERAERVAREERDREERLAAQAREAARAEREAKREEALTAMLMKVVEKMA